MDTLRTFEKYLINKQLVQDKQRPYYIRWVSNFLVFCKKSASQSYDGQIDPFLQNLAKTREEWQVKQAREAIRIFLFFLAQENEQSGEEVIPLDA